MTGRHLTTADVAEKLGVSVVAVYKMRSISNKLRRAGQEGPLLPEPVAIEGNSPLYDEAAIDAFAQERARRAPSQRGRRPRLMPGLARDAAFAERLRAAIADGAGAPEVPTQAALIDLLGLNVVTFGERMRGRTRWTDAELEVIRRTLGVDTTDANEVVDRARAAKRQARAARSHMRSAALRISSGARPFG